MWKFNGFFIQKRSNRNYKIPIASNILGYISEVNSNDLKNDSYYKTGELIGRQGIEKTYEKLLRGTKGKKFYKRIVLIELLALITMGFLILKNKEQKT